MEDPVNYVASNSSATQASIDPSVERYATAALSVSYLASDAWASTLTYTDQTWFGSPLNTSLARGVALMVQRRFAR